MKNATTVKQEISMMPTDFNLKQFILTTLIVSIWINISEVFRYFVIVKPLMREYLPMVSGIVPINWLIFASWGVWDTILTALVVFVHWLVAQRFGNNFMSTVIAATTSWALFFLLFWLGLVNMGLSSVLIAFMTLPLALLEMVVACSISSKLYAKNW
jgi:hypothetical protein